MTNALTEWAMVYAAGKGSRMMPLTAECPKPMLEVRGAPLLAHTLETLIKSGIQKAVVNTHYCAERIEEYLNTRTEPETLVQSHEDILLNTGGGLRHALTQNLIPTDILSVFTVNTDILLCDEEDHLPALYRLNHFWQKLGNDADVLLLLIPREKAWGHEPETGDYTIADAQGRLKRLTESSAPYVYSGIQITRTALYQSHEFGESFSTLQIIDRAEKKGRLFGLVHEGTWFHFSTPQALERFAEHEDEGESM